jgi:hypothetical protein
LPYKLRTNFLITATSRLAETPIDFLFIKPFCRHSASSGNGQPGFLRNFLRRPDANSIPASRSTQLLDKVA